MTPRQPDPSARRSPATPRSSPRWRDAPARSAGTLSPPIAPLRSAGLILVAIALLLLACSDGGDREEPEQDLADALQDAEALPRHGGTDAGKPEIRARAQLRPTEGHAATGTIEFAWTGAPGSEGTRIVAELRDLSSGAHAFHVHEFGDCSAPDASSAGDHFAFYVTEEPADRIVGNLGELRAGPDGRARLERVVPNARLAGPRSLIGQSVVVHAEGNDPHETPGGAAGSRIACGVIETIH